MLEFLRYNHLQKSSFHSFSFLSPYFLVDGSFKFMIYKGLHLSKAGFFSFLFLEASLMGSFLINSKKVSLKELLRSFMRFSF